MRAFAGFALYLINVARDTYRDWRGLPPKADWNP